MIVAIAALVVALRGTVAAASRYLINLTTQINPKVLRKLKGNVGRTGSTRAFARARRRLVVNAICASLQCIRA